MFSPGKTRRTSFFLFLSCHMLGSLLFLLSVFSRKVTPIHIMSKERTFIAVKPDGVQRGLIGEIIKRFEAKGFKLAGMKFMQASEDHLKKHYADLADKPFFPGLVKYMASGPLVAMCWEGTGIVKTARQMMGETKPADSKPGTIRGDFCIEVGRNIIHGSDSVESANKEISLWFKPEELTSWTQAAHDWIYELLDRLGDVATDTGLKVLNDFLQDKSYVQGYVPSKNDLMVFSKVSESVNKVKYPHVFRWRKHIKAICAELELNLGLYNFSAAAKDVKNETDSQLKNTKSREEKREASSKAVAHSSYEDLPNMTNDNSVTEKELRNSNDEKDSDVTCPDVSNVYAILLDVKPKDDETDMGELEDLVRGVTLDGLKWGASQLSSIGYGIYKLSIICTVEDDKSSIQDVLQKLIKFEDYVSNVDIAAFNKL